MGTFTPATMADKINQRRINLGVSVPELAEATGIPRTTLQRRLSGKQSFTMVELAEVSTHLKTPITEWFEGVA